MSHFIYIAADIPLKKIENPHYRFMSINEALAARIEVADFVLDSDIDRDKPEVVMWTDAQVVVDKEKGIIEDAGFDDDYSISPIEKWEEILTEKQYCASLDYDYTKGRALQVISYIKELLEHTDEVEIWSIWLGNDPSPQIKRIIVNSSELTPEVMKNIDEADSGWQEAPALDIVDLPADREDEQEEPGQQEIQYCFVICNSVTGKN